MRSSATLFHANPANPSAYFRKIIHLDNAVTQATLDVWHDDGIIVWVNGTQVFSRYVGSTGYGAFATRGGWRRSRRRSPPPTPC